MKVNLKRINKAFHFEARNEEGKVVHVDCAPEHGGEGKGIRPTELLLMSVGGCASIDLGLILRKQRQELIDYSVEISGGRSTDPGKQFTSIHLSFDLAGDLDPEKVEKAIELSIEKYCSVILSLHPGIRLTYNFTINPRP